MKNLSLSLNIVLFIGLGVLYFLHFNTESVDNKNITNVTTSSSELKIAYVNIDSVVANYNLAKELNGSLMKKQSNMKSKLEKDAKEFEKDAQIFQDKIQRGIFLTQERAQEAQQKLAMRQQELQKLEYDYSNQLAIEQQSMNKQLFDSINSYILEYNTPEKFQVIFGHSTGGSLLYGAEQLNITNDIIDGLNSKYESKK
jgi:outer membrane protein